MKTENDMKDKSRQEPASSTVEVTAWGGDNNRLWAKLEVRYWWSADGRTFTAETLRYQVDPNNRNSGDVYFRVEAEGDSGWSTLTTTARQDGQWHSLTSQTSVAGNSSFADISFHYDYDVAFAPDPRLRGSVRVKRDTPYIDIEH
ncbi:hypothetical protein [Pseudomonas brassicacearum]|uniref:Uncharacterized protein n=1 Tax=Pseudomonas brassicacearum TaxID=930166 RepID=A0AAJ3FXH3_9PSED|nr:hypothetical protein [Pseudomonas brassicacearum]NUT82168.1 hypothetical protein [Pseudomonas brassicacearum]QGA51774.1 hypothetical protein GFU70_22545 [Pseudomonas brassicacearum]